jgi:hypothetical protein
MSSSADLLVPSAHVGFGAQNELSFLITMSAPRLAAEALVVG